MEAFQVQNHQMSDSEFIMLFLTVSGGLQDAYTYWMREEVFANAQTGNIVLMTSYLFSGQWMHAIRYLIPVAAFACGVLAADQIRGRCQFRVLHWRQVIVAAEILLLLGAGFLPANANHLATAVISFACAMQVQAFRKVHGYGYASTMCIGNLRSGMEALSGWLRTGSPAMLGKAGQYFRVILSFAVGAGLGAVLTSRLGLHTIWVSCGLLLVCFCLMFLREEPAEHSLLPDVLHSDPHETASDFAEAFHIKSDK